MKYINKEYGFAFRPPFSDRFSEVTESGPEIDEHNYPQKYITGVGYDYAAVNGAMLVGKHGSMWGLRVQYYSGNKWLDNDDIIRQIGSSSANTADGGFAGFSCGPLSVKWAKFGNRSLVLYAASHKKLRVRIVFYPCFDCPGELSIEGATVSGRSPFVAVVPGAVALTDSNAVYRGRYLVLDDDRREYFHAVSYMPPSASTHGEGSEAVMEFVLNRRQPDVLVYASVGGAEVFDAQPPSYDSAKSKLEKSEKNYADNKTVGTGELGGAVERMLNAVLWSRVYYPYFKTEIFTPERSGLDNHFDITGVYENCSAILGSYVDAEKAAGQLSYTVEDKIMAVLAIWHNYMRMSDKRDMLTVYRALVKQYPPIASPVISDGNKNEVAYKWSDSPLKEKFDPAPMFGLDLSSLKLLAFDVIERIASLFDLKEKDKYAKAKADMRAVINDTFWCESEGLYLNRYTKGKWATNVGATSFYPLIAGAVDTAEKLSALVSNLTDVKKFWGDFVIPTLSMDNREYGKPSKPDNNGKRTPPFLKYRGSIVPYVNYIVYHGLKRYGLDEVAGAFAKKSVALWSANESDDLESRSLYLPKGKSGGVAGDRTSSDGNMLALIGLQELVDIEYFRPDLKTALCFGTFVNGSNSVDNLSLLGHVINVRSDDESTALTIDGANTFKGEGGKFKVRNFVLDGKGGCEFMIDAKQNTSIDLSLRASVRKSIKYFFIVPCGKSAVKAADGMVNISKIDA